MRHAVKKFKFSHGQDANQMLLRKLIYNFIIKGKITISKAKAKLLKSKIDRLISKAKEKTEANKNVLLKLTGNIKVVEILFEKIAPVFKERKSGFTRTITLGQRRSDASDMVQLEWIQPVVLEDKKEISAKKDLKKGVKTENTSNSDKTK